MTPSPVHARIMPSAKRYLYGITNEDPNASIILPIFEKKFEVRHISGWGRNSEMNGSAAVGRQIPIMISISPIFLAVVI